ncbi:MAG: LysM peptidoglycan-binding domain-containing protein [Chloroflexota bacterium]
MLKTSLRIILLTFILGMVGTSLVHAQDTANALQNGSFEEGSFGPYTQRRGGEKPIYLPGAWNFWLNTNTQNQYYNRADRVSMFPHPGPGPNPYDGARALNVDCGFVTCAVAVYQQVGGVTPGQAVNASAWSQVKACNLGGGSSCGSAIESGSQTRIGIDPAGGTDPTNPAIVWSAWVQPHDQWKQQSVSATATGGTVTVFLYSTQQNFSDLNKTYWDAAILSGGGAGSAAPGASGGTPAPTATPTPPPYVPFVAPQGAQSDGSIVHTVGAGDTIDSIAVAYGVTRSDIMELNKITDPRIISLGQKLIIKTATAPTAGPTSESSAAEPAATEAPTQEVVIGASGGDAQAQPTTESQAPTDTSPTQEAPAEQPTSDQPAEPTAIPPTAPVVVAQGGDLNPVSTKAQVCVIVFDDANQNRIQESGENLLPGGTITLALGSENVGTYTTDGTSEPHCFDNLDAGDYVALASAPSGYGLTTPDQLRLEAKPGPAINIAFGAAQGVQPVAAPPIDTGDAQPPVQEEAQSSTANSILANSGLIVFGLAAVVLIGGLGAAFFLRRR